MKKTSIKLAWFGSLILVAVVAYWFGTAQVNAPFENSSLQKNTEMPTPSVPQENEALLEENNNLTYTNNTYNFTLQLPERWRDYRVKEKKDDLSDQYNFELKLKNGQYNSVFVVSVITRADWEKLQTEEGPKPQYISEKNNSIFAYSVGHDDEGYAGFPEIIPELIYKGPFFDVQEIIIPSFSFIE